MKCLFSQEIKKPKFSTALLSLHASTTNSGWGQLPLFTNHQHGLYNQSSIEVQDDYQQNIQPGNQEKSKDEDDSAPQVSSDAKNPKDKESEKVSMDLDPAPATVPATATETTTDTMEEDGAGDIDMEKEDEGHTLPLSAQEA